MLIERWNSADIFSDNDKFVLQIIVKLKEIIYRLLFLREELSKPFLNSYNIYQMPRLKRTEPVIHISCDSWNKQQPFP
jgi:hypothetical protein